MELVIFDFDGTLTDIEKEAPEFERLHIGKTAELARIPIEEAERKMAQFRETVLRQPERYGWLEHGKIVAPATSDPYLLQTELARMLFQKMNIGRSEDGRTELIKQIYLDIYPGVAPVARDGAENLLADLKRRVIQVAIVTNSAKEAVIARISRIFSDEIARWLAPNVWGLAAKNRLDRGFDLVPEFLTVAGWPRPIYCRRSSYFALLNELREEKKLDWRDILVIGDNFELDLVLPWCLTARVAQVQHGFALPHEIEFMRQHGAVITDLTLALTL